MFVAVIIVKKPNGVFAHRLLGIKIYENKFLVKVTFFRIFCYNTRFKSLYYVACHPLQRQRFAHAPCFVLSVGFKLKIGLFRCFQKIVNNCLGIPKFSLECTTGDRCTGTEKKTLLSVRKYKK
jgi:hypothetical protein